MMKVSLICAALIFGASGASAEPVLIPYDPEYPPMSKQTETGPEGFDIIVAQEIAKVLASDFEFIPSDFDKIQGEDWPADWSFTVSSTSYSEEREERFHFIGPYYMAAVVLVRSASDAESEPNDEPFDLPDGTRVGVCNGCIYKDYIDGNYLQNGTEGSKPLGNVSAVPFAFETDILRALVNGGEDSVDYAITSAAFAQHFRNIGFPLEQVGPPLFVEPLWITQPIRASDAELQALDAAFRKVATDGLIAAASEKFLGGDFSVVPE
ncbi:MAG: transporter substrate-binding domain-containing protein [Paracoccaceae bacterium]